MPRNQPLEAPPSQLQSLLVHWVMVAAGEQMPRKEDFRVRSLTAWREHVALVSPAAYGDYQYYLFHVVGRALDARFGRVMVQKGVHDIDDPLREPLHAALAFTRMNCAPAFRRETVPRGDGTNVTWCDLLLPLYEGDMPGGKIIFASYPVEEADSRGDAEARRSPAMIGSGARM